MWDLVIVGAGPAGSSAAMAALAQRPEAQVLMLDRAEIGRDKSCGDGIAPHAIDILRALGGPTAWAGHPEVATLELANGDVDVVRQMNRPALVVPRATFDATLARAAINRGAQFRRCQVRTVEPRQGSVVLNGSIEARMVIAADGVHSSVRRATGTRQIARGKVAMALRGYAPTPSQRAGRQVIRFGQTRQPSYAWSFDRGDGWANIGYGEVLHASRFREPLSKPMMIEQIEQMLPGSTRGGEQWLGHHLPLSAPYFAHPGGPILYAGDAASLINPLTGEGIYYAVATGAIAGVCSVQARASVTAAVAYRNTVRRLLEAHLVTTAALSRAVRIPGLLDIGLSAAAADAGAFDDLVEVGLGRGTVTGRLVAALVRSRMPSRSS